MSERMIPLKIADMAVAACNEEIAKLQAENARLKAEVERLRSSSFVTAVPVEQYERVIKAGDELSWAFSFAVSRHDGEPSGLVKAWNAAKEGKQS